LIFHPKTRTIIFPQKKLTTLSPNLFMTAERDDLKQEKIITNNKPPAQVVADQIRLLEEFTRGGNYPVITTKNFDQIPDWEVKREHERTLLRRIAANQAAQRNVQGMGFKTGKETLTDVQKRELYWLGIEESCLNSDLNELGNKKNEDDLSSSRTLYLKHLSR
jgi:hypothetical protein